LELSFLCIYENERLKGSSDSAVKLLPCDHEVMGSSLGNSLLQKFRRRLHTIKPKVVGPCTSGSYMHRASFYIRMRSSNSTGNWEHIVEYRSVTKIFYIRLLQCNGVRLSHYLMYCAGTMELGSDGVDCTEKTCDLSNSCSDPSMGNRDPEDNISSIRELCTPLSMNSFSFPSSAPQNAASHIKWPFPGFCKESSHDENDCLTNDAASEATECVQDMIQDCVRGNVNIHRTTQTDNEMSCSGIDPFWPFCMFELRGKCNDEECQWQHAEHRSWRKSKHTKHATASVSGF
jgi:hypothetical protein